MTNTIKIPQELKRFRTRACYDNLKQLISATSGFKILPSDFLSLASWESACEYGLNHTRQVKGLAFVLPKGYVCVDIESTADPKTLEEWLSLPTYIEKSQNASSYHIILALNFNEQVRSSTLHKITILSEGNYVCLTGDVMIGESEVSHELETRFTNLYNKYFLNKTDANEKSYFFTRLHGSEEITEEIVKNRIITSLASNRYYSLMNGDYVQVGFVEKNEAIIALFNILFFWSSGSKKMCYDIFKESKLYSPSLEEKFNSEPLIDVLYKNAVSQQQCIYDKDTYIAEEYVFDFNKCVMRHFKGYSLDDTGNALRLYDKFGDILKYDMKNGVFLVYNEQLGIYEEDYKDNVKLKRMLDVVLEDMKMELHIPKVENEGKQKEFLRNIAYLSSTRGKANCIEELKHLDNIPCMPYEFDSDDMLLNTLDGVINLKNGQLLEHNKNFMMTKSTRCHIDMNNRPIKFEDFMWETMCNDKVMYDYMQRLMGYCLTGSTKEQSWYPWYGGGNNGKSVLENVYRAILGDYAVNTPIASFLKRKIQNGGEATPDRARFQGARVIFTNEPASGDVLDESFLKTVTGGDVITVRKLHKDFYEFHVKGKVIMPCNDMARIYGTSRGDWRRVKKIDFNNDVREEDIDKELFEKLKEEVPQILGNYALRGCIEWQNGGIRDPQSVIDSVNQFREESNSVLNFLTNYTTQSTFSQVLSVDLYSNYMKWARQVNENTNISLTKFGSEVKKSISILYPNVQKVKTNGNKTYYRGIRLLAIDEGEFTASDLHD